MTNKAILPGATLGVEPGGQPPDLDEDFLSNFLALGWIANDSFDESIHGSGDLVVQLPEGCLVAARSEEE